jgi:hypothetical protein
VNVGKFHFVIQTVCIELEKCSLIEELDQLRSSLSTSLSQQSIASSDEFKNALNNFKQATDACPSNSFTVSEHEILVETNGAKLTGNGLYKNVLHTLTVNNMTPVDAVTGLNQIHTKLSKYKTSIDNLVISFGELEIEFDELKSKEYEIGYLIPREITDNTLKGVVNEFKSLDDLLLTIKEIVSEEVGSNKIRTISNSAFQVFLESTPVVIGFIIVSVERIVALMKSVLELKQLYDSMQNKSIPDKIVEDLKLHIDSSISIGIGKIAQELIQEHYSKKDSGRANELETLLRKHLSYLADRIDKGATIEAKMGMPNDENKADFETENQLFSRIEQFKQLTLETTTTVKHTLQIVDSTRE